MNSNGVFFYASLGQAFSKINPHNSRDASMMQVLLVHILRMSLGPLHDHPCCERHEPSRIFSCGTTTNVLLGHTKLITFMLYSNFIPSAMRSPSSHWFWDLPLSALRTLGQKHVLSALTLPKMIWGRNVNHRGGSKKNKLTYKYRIMYIYIHIYIIWAYIDRWCLQLRNQWINDAPEPHGAGPGPSVEPDADGGSNR